MGGSLPSSSFFDICATGHSIISRSRARVSAGDSSNLARHLARRETLASFQYVPKGAQPNVGGPSGNGCGVGERRCRRPGQCGQVQNLANAKLRTNGSGRTQGRTKRPFLTVKCGVAGLRGHFCKKSKKGVGMVRSCAGPVAGVIQYPPRNPGL